MTTNKKIIEIEWLPHRDNRLFKCTFQDGRYDYFVRGRIPSEYDGLVKKAVLSNNKKAKKEDL